MQQTINQIEREQNAAYWDRVTRRRARSQQNPPQVIYDLKTPLVFDCRFKTNRRIGIGDQFCLLSAIQAVSEKMGGGVEIQHDTEHPGSTAVFGMSGLPVATRSAIEPRNIIPCRHHPFDPAIGSARSYYAEKVGCPVAQYYHNWGWHDVFKAPPIKLSLYPSADAQKQADAITGGIGSYVTCTPLEASRHNNDTTPAVWRRALGGIKAGTILFGCSQLDRGWMFDFVADMGLTQRTQIITTSLAAWKCLIDSADRNYTGNSAGMWLSFASSTPTTLLQCNDVEHPHNTMWDYKTEWKCANISVEEVEKREGTTQPPHGTP